MNLPTSSNGNSLISKRWHSNIKQTINQHNFKLDGTFDSLVRSNNRCKCDFCGSNLRYVAIIKDDINTLRHQIGLDCLALVFGADWVDLGKAQRQIKVLKTEAAKASRKERYATEYAKIINWLREVLKYTDDTFLTSMYEILTTGRTIFTKNMFEAVKKAASREKFDVQKLRDKHDRIGEILQNIDGLLELIQQVDVLGDGERNNTLDFVTNVRSWVHSNGHITDKQSEGLAAVRKRYVRRKKRWTQLNIEYKKRCEIPF